MLGPVFSLSQVAGYFGVDQSSIRDWIGAGTLRAHRQFGTDDYWVPFGFLVDTLDNMSIALPAELRAIYEGKILLIGVNRKIEKVVRESIVEPMRFEVRVVNVLKDVDSIVQSYHPDCIVIDSSIGEENAGAFARSFHNNEALSSPIVVGYNYSQEGIGWASGHFDHLFGPELNYSRVTGKIQALIMQRKYAVHK